MFRLRFVCFRLRFVCFRLCSFVFVSVSWARRGCFVCVSFVFRGGVVGFRWFSSVFVLFSIVFFCVSFVFRLFLFVFRSSFVSVSLVFVGVSLGFVQKKNKWTPPTLGGAGAM